MTVNHDCQLDWVQNHVKDKPLVMSGRALLEMFNMGAP